MSIITITEFVKKVKKLEIGKSACYHRGFLAIDRVPYPDNFRANRLNIFIDLSYTFNFFEIYARREAKMLYSYYVRKRCEWPHPIIEKVAMELDTKRNLEGWFMESKEVEVRLGVEKLRKKG